MPRPKIKRCLRFKPHIFYFKPRGIPIRHLEEVSLQRDELEALKLYDIDSLDQTQAAKKMNISQPTFTRIIQSAHQKLAQAIINGQAIKIIK